MKSAGAIQKNTEKRASRDVLFPLCENAADKLILFVLLGSVLLFILWPIACIALRSLRGADGGVSFAMFGTVLRQYGESLRNSVFVGVFTAVLSTILSLSAALVCATARGWKKTLCMIIMLVAMVSPPFVSSLAYIQLYGRRGWITYRLLHLSLNPYNRWGVILMQSISFVPLNAMFLSGILEKLDEGSLRSARDLGASGGAILRDIVLPLIRSATLVCLLLSFVRSLADFGTPIIIGGRFSGASRGPVIGHVSPEAAVGGPIALVEEGDLIRIDVPGRVLAIVGVKGEEKTPGEIDAILAARRARWQAKPPKYKKGLLKRYTEHAVSPMKGAYME